MTKDGSIPAGLAIPEVVAALKGAGEPTRLRILLLLRGGELNVKDLTHILGQSQPRLSRHLKLLVEAGLIERAREGSWVYFHLSDRGIGGELVRRMLDVVDLGDGELVRDRNRREALQRERESAAQDYFETHAGDWDRIRALHVDDGEVERAMREMLPIGPYETFLDLGTGTGRTLEVFAERYQQGLGVDVNQSMLAYARSKIDKAGLTNARVRHGDMYSLALPNAWAGAIVIHQVLHFLSDPARALKEAARVLKPGGSLLIVDFAPHDFEFLREEHAHERLGLGDDLIRSSLAEAGVTLRDKRELVAPTHGSEKKLTVSLWHGVLMPDDAGRSNRIHDLTLEEI